MKKGVLIAMVGAVLGALAVAPRPGYGSEAQGSNDPNDPNSPAYQAAYRKAYNDAYAKAQADEQKKIDEKDSQQQGGCCG